MAKPLKPNNYIGCNSAFFSTYVLNYTKVCGRVRGYQYGYPYAFLYNINNYNSFFNSEIKTHGVTLTYGNNPCKHIWTYAGGNHEQGTYSNRCPCNNGSEYMNYTIPFVSNDYYCESGSNVFNLWALFPMIPSGMVKSVLEMRLPAVLLLKCHGLSKHKMKQLMMILN